MDYSLPGSSVHGILQARILEWVTFLSPGDLPDLGIEPGSPALQADSLLLSHQGSPYFEYLLSKVMGLLSYKGLFTHSTASRRIMVLPLSLKEWSRQMEYVQ